MDGNLICRTVTTGGKTTADTYAYDGAGMLISETRTQDGVQKYDYQYEYDNRGNRTILSDSVSGVYTRYNYDLNNRLTTSIKYLAVPNAYTESADYYYDANGNLTASLMNTLDFREVYSDDYFDITTDYGDLLKGYAFTQYEYDVYNRLTSFKNGEHEATYTYNPGNLRRTKTVDGKTTQYVWDGSEIAAEIDKDYDVIRNKYIYGLDRVLCEGPYSVNTYYQQNSHGDTVAITDSYADTLVMYEYDAFGNQLNPDLADSNPFRYCGQYLDNETGSYYLRARYYQPTYGRFLTADTHWNTGNMIYGDNSVTQTPDISVIIQSNNLYVYCFNNPVLYSDYSGYYTQKGTPPPPSSGFVPPKGKSAEESWNNDRGGWEDKKGNIWQPDTSNHGKNRENGSEEHWDVQRKDGKGYRNVGKDGKTWGGKGKAPNLPKKEEETNTDNADIGNAIGTGALGLAGGILIWEAGKWLLALVTAPISGGMSVAVAAATP